MIKRIFGFGLVVFLADAFLPAWSPAVTLTLYDGSQSGLPTSQGSLAYAATLGTATQTLAGGTAGPTVLATNSGGSDAEHAGYSNYSPSGSLVNAAFPNLNPVTGFDLTFGLKIDAESHSSNDRAGFSVILLGSNLSGIELGFWQDEVFAQSATPTLFTHGLSTSGFDPTVFHEYDLHIQGGNYSLLADGTQILTGTTQNYSAEPLPQGLPYRIPDFLFLGDDTTSAQGVSELQSAAVIVPEPAGLAVLSLAAGAMLRRRHHPSPAVKATTA